MTFEQAMARLDLGLSNYRVTMMDGKESWFVLFKGRATFQVYIKAKKLAEAFGLKIGPIQRME